MSGRAVLIGSRFLRENPGPPERPEREERGPGNGRWFFGALAALLLAVVLGRLVGPAAVTVLWALGFGVYGAVRAYRILKKGPDPRD